MNKFEMAQLLSEKADANGRVTLKDFADLVFDADSPQDVVEEFLANSDDLVSYERLMNDVINLNKKIELSSENNVALLREFHVKYEELKAITKKLGLDDYIDLP